MNVLFSTKLDDHDGFRCYGSGRGYCFLSSFSGIRLESTNSKEALNPRKVFLAYHLRYVVVLDVLFPVGSDGTPQEREYGSLEDSVVA